MNTILIGKEILLTRLVLISILFVSLFSSENVLANKDHVHQTYMKLKADFASLSRSDKHNFKTNKQSSSSPTLRIIAGNGHYFNGQSDKTVQPREQWDQFKSAVHKQKVKIHRNFERYQYAALSVTEKQLDALVNSGEIDLLLEDQISYINLDQSIPFIGADLMQASGFGGQDYAVAILDSGVDSQHSFFAGRIVEEACFSSGDGVNSFSLCPNGETRQLGFGAADDCTDRFTTSDCRHGTHVAGIAAGMGTSFSGVAPNAKIVAVQVFTYFTSNGRLGAYMSDQVAALDWLLYDAGTPNIVAANMSLGSGQHSQYCDHYPQAPLITQLRAAGIATVIASGNDGYNGAVSAPGCISSAVTVGSTLKYDDVLSSFSNSANLVDLLAPGSSIYSAVPGGQYAWMSGTSMAAPHISGAIALLKSAVPAATIDEVELALKASGHFIMDAAANVTMPRVDMLAAHQYLLDLYPAPSPSPSPSPSPTITPSPTPSPTPTIAPEMQPGCQPLPGIISQHGGSLVLGQTKSWGIYADNGGLYRVYLTSAANTGSHGVNVSIADYSVDISVAAGLTSIIDFPTVPAGSTSLSVTANTSGVVIGQLDSEIIWANGQTAPPGCQHFIYPVPSVVTDNVGAITQDESRNWYIALEQAANLRLSLVSNSLSNSREIELMVNGVSLLISMNPGFTTFIDFPGMSAGEYSISVKAMNEDVSLGRLELLTY